MARGLAFFAALVLAFGVSGLMTRGFFSRLRFGIGSLASTTGYAAV